METTAKDRLAEYLTTGISAEDLALYLRRLKLEVVRFVLNDGKECYDKEWVSDGLYFLDNLCEMLDPYLEKE